MKNEKDSSGNVLQFPNGKNIREGYLVSLEEKSLEKLKFLLSQRGADPINVVLITGIPIEKIVPRLEIPFYSDQLRKISKNESNSAKFAKLLYDEGYLREDLSLWNLLVKLYENSGKELPEKFSDKLRLEIFLSAKFSQRESNQKPVIAYNTLGIELESKWFEDSLAQDEDFISEFVMRASNGMNEDIRGFYREDQDGNRWREVVGSGENGIICDSTELALRRNLFREANTKSQNQDSPFK